MTAKMVQAWIGKMPPADLETCEEIAAHIRAVAKTAGRDVAINAVFLVAFLLKESEPSNDRADLPRISGVSQPQALPINDIQIK